MYAPTLGGVAAFVAFVIAAVLRLVGKYPGAVIWLVIVGGLIVSASLAWGWARPRYAATAARP